MPVRLTDQRELGEAQLREHEVLGLVFSKLRLTKLGLVFSGNELAGDEYFDDGGGGGGVAGQERHEDAVAEIGAGPLDGAHAQLHELALEEHNDVAALRPSWRAGFKDLVIIKVLQDYSDCCPGPALAA